MRLVQIYGQLIFAQNIYISSVGRLQGAIILTRPLDILIMTGRHDSSNGIPLKIRRPPGDLFHHQTPQPSISITDDSSSVVSAFAVRTDGSRTVVADGHSQDGYGFASADVEQGHFLHGDDDTISTVGKNKKLCPKQPPEQSLKQSLD